MDFLAPLTCQFRLTDYNKHATLGGGFGRERSSLVTQLVKNPPAMQETPVLFLGWEDPLEKGKATNSSILAWGIPGHGVTKSWTQLSDFRFLSGGGC